MQFSVSVEGAGKSPGCWEGPGNLGGPGSEGSGRANTRRVGTADLKPAVPEMREKGDVERKARKFGEKRRRETKGESHVNMQAQAHRLECGGRGPGQN